ncbi:MAG: phytanoyl-CoA dioxygenase family protein [Proteobacteria bacterium]|nr:phytanoyl-CoA dioxygenase family protein [Pseudomonadota bacterium]
MTVCRIDGAAGATAALAAMERDGAVILTGRAEPGAMDRVVAELRPWWDAARTGLDDFRGRATRRVGGLIARSAAFRELILDEACLALAEHALRPHCRRIQLNYTQLILLGPGESAQPLHRDDEVWAWPREPGAEWSFIGMWAASEFTEANGATRIVPGSHLWPRDRVARSEEVVSAEMAKGDVLLHYGSVLHGGGANVTADSIRIGISFNHALGWLRQIENQFLTVPVELARELPLPLQNLIGYAVHGRILGETALEDPRVALLGRSAEEIEASDEAAQAVADRATLAGYG